MAFSMMTKPKVHYKNRDLFDKLNVFFGESVNLARIKFLSLMILALYKVQTVSFYKLSIAFESDCRELPGKFDCFDFILAS